MRRALCLVGPTAAVLASGVLLAAEPRPGDVESKTNPGIFYRMTKSFDGAITKDDFSAAAIDAKLWEVRQTPDLKVYTEGGTLHIKGEWPKDPGNTGGMIGVFSQPAHSPRTRILNAVMAARLRFNHSWHQEGFDRSPTMEFHFCGTSPDINTSIARSWRQGRLAWGLAGGGGLGTTKKLDARPRDDEALAKLDDHEWQTLFITQAKGLGDGYLLGPDGRWLHVGGPRLAWLNVKRLELKVLHGAPGYRMDLEFDDARLYPHPADHPARVAIWVHDSRDPRRLWPFTVKVTSADGARVLAQAAGGPGGDLFDMTLPADVLYPVAARVQVFRGDQLDAEFPVAQEGVEGLYPGDIWHVYCVPPPRQ